MAESCTFREAHRSLTNTIILMVIFGVVSGVFFAISDTTGIGFILLAALVIAGRLCWITARIDQSVTDEAYNMDVPKMTTDRKKALRKALLLDATSRKPSASSILLLALLLISCQIKTEKVDFPSEPNRFSIPNPPDSVAISYDSTAQLVTVKWRDSSDNEDGFKVAGSVSWVEVDPDRHQSENFTTFSVPEDARTSAGWGSVFFVQVQGRSVNGGTITSVSYQIQVTSFNRGGESPKATATLTLN